MNLSGGATQIKFGTDGWRGIIADDFTFANVCRVTWAIAQYLETAYSKNHPILVAYDSRFLADQFAYTAAKVLVDFGWQVKLVDRDCPTPVIAFSTQHLQAAGALMFTASHNPAVYCGIKYIPDYGGPATTEITDKIMVHLEAAEHFAPSGQNLDLISTFNPKLAYLQSLYNLIDVERIRTAKLNVKYDALYSTSRGYLDAALQHCGCAVETFHAYRDVFFGGNNPEPNGKQLSNLIKAVQANPTDLGLATDGDGDRFGVVDEQGNVLSANEVLLLLAKHLVKNKGKSGAIVRTVATTYLLDNFAAQYGLEIYETPVGFKYIGEKMRQTQVLIGGEESGGLSIAGHIPEKDGILAGLLVTEAIAYEGKPLSQLVKEVLAEVGGPVYNQRLDAKLSNLQKATLLNIFRNHPPSELAGIPLQAVDNTDGVKLLLEDKSWVLLRPSGTEPLMRIQLETNSPEKVTRLAASLKDIISQLELAAV